MEEKMEMQNLKLPRLLSDGAVLQCQKRIRIWGWDSPGRTVTVRFLEKEYSGSSGEDGRWQAWLPACDPGGPYLLEVWDDAGERICLSDILVGTVWFCSGQSNMELPMERVRDRYPKEVANCENPRIRTFKITEKADFKGPAEELDSGEWKAAAPDTILRFSATAYFFAKELFDRTQIPVGFIDASLGGSLIESWMSRRMLEGYEDKLALADRYADPDFVSGVLAQNMRQAVSWHRELDSRDRGLAEGWEKEETDRSLWEPICLPAFFADSAPGAFIGSLWFCKTFDVPADMARKEAHLWLGTIVDSDTAYINGVRVGHTDYQYPPRKYRVPKGLLREGRNTLVIRVICERGNGRFTPEKRYALWDASHEIDLSGGWLYRTGAVCPPAPGTDFVSWKPTGLYNGMTAPCHSYVIQGILWYQGESNAGEPGTYLDLTRRMVEGYRRCWQEELPFYFVQLPNFTIDLAGNESDGTASGWPQLREVQRQSLRIPGTGMAVAIDLGEDNDLHPHNKKDVGRRLALLALQKVFHQPVECSGPEPAAVEVQPAREGEICLRLRLAHSDGLYAASVKSDRILDFVLEGRDGRLYPMQASIEGRDILLTAEAPKDSAFALRYAYGNTNRGALVYNGDNLPMSPFLLELTPERIVWENKLLPLV